MMVLSNHYNVPQLFYGAGVLMAQDIQDKYPRSSKKWRSHLQHLGLDAPLWYRRNGRD